MLPNPAIAKVLLDIPLTRHPSASFDYRIPPEFIGKILPGAWVVVPFGRRLLVGIVIECAKETNISEDRLKPLGAVIGEAPVLPETWLSLVRFTANYYHRNLGEIAIPAIPSVLRKISKRRATSPPQKPVQSPFALARKNFQPLNAAPTSAAGALLTLTEEQEDAARQTKQLNGFGTFLLYGITGSGKTEVYLRWFSEILSADPNAQVLLLIPEISLTAQVENVVASRFPNEPIAVLHSGLNEKSRAANWLAIAERRARIVIGTRLSVFAPFPALSAIVVDEEHDPSYKQQEGPRYSARDLAIAKASLHKCPVLLGSATPSLESWHAAIRGRYRLLCLTSRAGSGVLPTIEYLHPPTAQHSLGENAIKALRETLSEGKQALIFINRRGYAPILRCSACGWISQCSHCSVYKVYHRANPQLSLLKPLLICHHCGDTQAAPTACTACRSPKISPLGKGTQRLEEELSALFPEQKIARLDRDVLQKNSAQNILSDTHAGKVDILIGTQMLAKGHDFRRLALVLAVECDTALFASNFRATESLFSLLMQVCGRAGRAGDISRVLIQTQHPTHPLFEFLRQHDYPGFAAYQLKERLSAALPPFRHQVLLLAQAPQKEKVEAFLRQAREAGIPLIKEVLMLLPQSFAPPSWHQGAGHSITARWREPITLFDPVPMNISRRADQERMQLLVEATSRSVLHQFLRKWIPVLRKIGRAVSWQIDVDPLAL